LLIDGKKMAKSDANIVTIENISKKFNPLAFRYLNLTAHYRSKLNLTWESMEGAQNALNNLYDAVREFKSTADFNLSLGKLADSFGLAGKKTKEILKKFREYKEEFTEAVNDDLDTPKALGIAWKLIGDQNIPASLKNKLLEDFDQVFGLKLKEIKPIAIPEEIKKMLKERSRARKEKDWVRSDELRKKIEAKGWLMEDTSKGTTVKPKK
jgi:cysteinyl-tRNA synthetase